jgi:hypothetical protein
MSHEVTLAQAEWYRQQASRFIKLAAAMEDILKNENWTSIQSGDGKQKSLFIGNKPVPSFEQVQREAAKGGRVKNMAARLDCDEQSVRGMLTAPNSKFFIGDKGWIRPNGWIPFKGSK